MIFKLAARQRRGYAAALFVLPCIYFLAAVANRSQLKRCIEVRIGLLADTSVLISSSASLRQSSKSFKLRPVFIPFLVVEMTLMFDKLLKPRTLQTRRQPVQVVCIHVKLQLRCSCNTTCEGPDLTPKWGHIRAPHCQTQPYLLCVFI